jgi:hypothetical protein
VLPARPGTPPQCIGRNCRFCGDVHLCPKWAPTMCPFSASSAQSTSLGYAAVTRHRVMASGCSPLRHNLGRVSNRGHAA